ncbi:MAG: hypothetical protein OXR66_00705 [Candidatus Woesearchaeota archaeon]|nr:hypothetical protein [Candidatus Woesearchaeota archaeon]
MEPIEETFGDIYLTRSEYIIGDKLLGSSWILKRLGEISLAKSPVQTLAGVGWSFGKYFPSKSTLRHKANSNFSVGVRKSS